VIKRRVNLPIPFNTKQILDFIADPTLILDGLGNIEFCNTAFADLLGYTDTPTLFGQNIINYLADDTDFQACLTQIRKHRRCQNDSAVLITQDKRYIAVTKSVKLFSIEEEEYIFVNIKDTSRIEQINKELSSSKRELEERSRQLNDMLDAHKKEIEQKQLQLDEIINLIDEIIWYIDDKTMEIKYVSNAIETIFQEKKDCFLESSSLWMEMIYPEDKQKVMEFFTNIQSDRATPIEFRIQRQDGSVRWLANTITHHPSLNFFIGVTHDVTGEKEYQENIEFMAYHDTLTGLPNRSYLRKEIDTLLRKSQIIEQNFALLFLDLDNFKYINDSMGHEVGDEILIHLSKVLQNNVGSKGTCIRFGGDEFIIVLYNIQNDKDIKIAASALIEQIKQPLIIHEREFFLSASIGIALYPRDARSATELIKAADTAMYQAKLTGKNRSVFYETDMDMSVQKFVQIERIIKDSLSEKLFEVYFQPLIDAQTMQLYGFEALMRLHHPKHGTISPELFIRAAESSGDILSMSKTMLYQVCQFTKEINRLSAHPLFISVNLSARQFKEPYFARTFLRFLKANDVDPSLIKIEIVESAVMENLEMVTKELQILRSAGVGTALDDFGTGYSSFSYLAKLPIDTIKIDKSFIIEMLGNEHTLHIVQAIISLGHHLGKKIVAEGVETQAIIKQLKHDNVDIMQGFYFHKAVSAKTIFQEFDNLATLFHLDS
jgi:diguanylate cyclase (GGDEF)-like protein/PAS domain S-box-containing protein